MPYKFNKDVTAERLWELFDYEPATGKFTRRSSVNNYQPAGTIAGTIGRLGYITIRVDKKAYMAHRLAWLYYHGEWPAHEIDHINRVKTDNRISNLRVATRAENVRNHGRISVLSRPNGKFTTKIRIDGRQVYLGIFDTADAARDAYVATSRRVFGEFSSHS